MVFLNVNEEHIQEDFLISGMRLDFSDIFNGCITSRSVSFLKEFGDFDEIVSVGF